MRNILLLCVLFASFCLTGCTTTEYCVSVDQYNQCLVELKDELKAQGYDQSGIYKDVENRSYAYTKAFVQSSGAATFKNAAANNYVHVEKYTFTNAKGDDVEFKVNYRFWNNPSIPKNYLFSTFDFIGCATSNAADYERLCDTNSIIYRKIAKMQPDITVKIL